MNHGKVNYYEKAELLRECTIRDYEKVFFHETEKVRNTKRNMRNIVHNVSLHVMEEKSVWAWRKKKKKKKKERGSGSSSVEHRVARGGEEVQQAWSQSHNHSIRVRCRLFVRSREFERHENET